MCSMATASCATPVPNSLGASIRDRMNVRENCTMILTVGAIEIIEMRAIQILSRDISISAYRVLQLYQQLVGISTGEPS